MNLQELIEEIAIENDIKKGRVRKIATSLMEKISQTLEADQVVRTPTIVFRPAKSDNPDKLGIVKRTPSNEEVQQ